MLVDLGFLHQSDRQFSGTECLNVRVHFTANPSTWIPSPSSADRHESPYWRISVPGPSQAGSLLTGKSRRPRPVSQPGPSVYSPHTRGSRLWGKSLAANGAALLPRTVWTYSPVRTLNLFKAYVPVRRPNPQDVTHGYYLQGYSW